MRRRRFLTLAACSAAVAAPGSCAAAASPSSAAAVSVVPLLRFARGAQIEVPVAFANDSSAPFKYLTWRQFKSRITDLEFLIYRDGKALKQAVYFSGPILDKDNPQTLEPGKHVVDYAQISIFYGDLEPGTYELRARYDKSPQSGDVERFGVTPLSFNRTIAYFEIVDAAKPAVRKVAEKGLR